MLSEEELFFRPSFLTSCPLTITLGDVELRIFSPLPITASAALGFVYNPTPPITGYVPTTTTLRSRAIRHVKAIKKTLGRLLRRC